ncbi:hypothetical protein D3C80_1670420 [compost metagenome]
MVLCGVHHIITHGVTTILLFGDTTTMVVVTGVMAFMAVDFGAVATGVAVFIPAEQLL